MNFFPTPYPDELLYSVLGRYAMRSGNINEIHTITDLFATRNSIAIAELPSRLEALIKNMPVNSTYSEEYFISKHTLFPCYAAFTSPGRAKEIISCMKNGDGSAPYRKLGLTSGHYILNKHLRFCPECMKEDIKLFGEPYWHRIHQVTGIFVCNKHKTPLYDSKVLMRGSNRQRLINIDKENCVVEKEIRYSSSILKKMIIMTEDISEILEKNYEFKGNNWFKNQFKYKLITTGYANMNNYIFQKKLICDFVEFYEEDYLNLCQSPINNIQNNWITNIVRKGNYSTYFIRYLLITRFLEIPLNQLFTKKLFLNECNSAKSYTYQDIWDERLKELIILELSIKEIAAILGATPQTIRKRIDELEIEPFRKYNGGGKYINVKYIKTEEFKEKRENSRKIWMELLNKYPNKSSNKIRQDNQALYRWLTKYDIEWLRKHSRTSNRKNNVVDWNKRDAELLGNVKKVIEEMKVGKPERITWTTIAGKLGISGWLSKKKDKLPLTKAFIESEIETLDEFHIRKIKWALDELDRTGKRVTKWNIIETSGVKLRYWSAILNDIKNILSEKGYGIDL